MFKVQCSKYLAAILVCGLSMMGFSSCKNDNVGNGNTNLTELFNIDDITYLDSKYVSYYDLLWDIINDHSDQESYDDKLYYDWATDYLNSLETQEVKGATRAGGFSDDAGETLTGMKSS